MAFWGVEVKPGKPYTHPSNKTTGRLRLSQATLGLGVSTKKSIVQCNVGDKSPVLLCCLLPDKSEYCHLELEFEEDEEVVFSVVGPRSVHLTGYYLSISRRHPGFGDSSESYGEDIGQSDTEKSNGCSDEDDYEDSFINDGDVEFCRPSPALSGEETNEEIMDNKKDQEEKGCQRHRRLRKKYQLSESEDDGIISQQDFANGLASVQLQVNEDEDKIPISSLIRCDGTGNQQKLAEDKVSKAAVDSQTARSNPNDDKSIGANGVVDADSKSEPGIPHTSMVAKNEKELKTKKKAKKRAKKDNVNHDSVDNNNISKARLHTDETKLEDFGKDLRLTNEQRKAPAIGKKLADYAVPGDASQSDERKSKRKKRKIKENKVIFSMEKQAMPSKDESMTMEIDKQRPSQVRTFSNGLVVEEVELGKHDGELASSGKKVKINYAGKLKEGGHIYDTNIGRDSFKFRLGKGSAIEGLHLGLEGMRVGGRRRLTVPPELGYGSEGIADSVPPNSWLILDVELLQVR